MANVNEAAQKYSNLGTRIQKQLQENMIGIPSFSAKSQLLTHLSHNLVFLQKQK